MSARQTVISKKIAHQLVLIIDFGSQVTRLIARRLRENNVYCEIHPFDKVDADFLEDKKPQAIILSGGPSSVLKQDAPMAAQAVFDAGVPVLGICYGLHLMAIQLGGEVAKGEHEREFGRAEINPVAASLLLDGLAENGAEPVWMSHGDHITRLPSGFHVIASSKSLENAAIANTESKMFGVQFHPEVTHTPNGDRLLRNFTHRIARLKGDWNMASYRNEAIGTIREKVGSARVICGLSGGVDSAVAAALVHQAIGDQLTCIFVDTGLMRAGEAQQVVSLFREHFHVKLVHLQARDKFLPRLAGISDPEQKRKIIGNIFIELFEEEAAKIEGAEFLAQGTLYPDVIESISAQGGPSVTIKSHHNVGGLPERMHLKLLEPLRELFKDEVRRLGYELGLPESFVGRHPFPGPGLAIRIIGEVDEESLDILRKADEIYLQEIRAAGLYDSIWQAFAVLLPVRSVGVMGDGRTYERVCALRAVSSTDGMTADFSDISHKILAHIASRIVNEVAGINRVVYDITSKPPGTIEWE